MPSDLNTSFLYTKISYADRVREEKEGRDDKIWDEVLP